LLMVYLVDPFSRSEYIVDSEVVERRGYAYVIIVVGAW
jgi:hypothetical protein